MKWSKRKEILLSILATNLMLVVFLTGCGKVFVPMAKDHLLITAAENGNVELVRQLLDSGVNADVRDGWNGSPLFYAAGNGHLEIVKLLLDRGVGVNTRYRMNKTALIIASQGGEGEVVTYLVSVGADRLATDTDGKTAYDHAIKNGHTELAKKLK